MIDRISNTRDLQIRGGSSNARVDREASNAYNLMMGIVQTTREMNR